MKIEEAFIQTTSPPTLHSPRSDNSLIESLYLEPDTVTARRNALNQVQEEIDRRTKILVETSKEMLVPPMQKLTLLLHAIPKLNILYKRRDKLRRSITLTLHKDRFIDSYSVSEKIREAKQVPVTNFIATAPGSGSSKLHTCPLHEDKTPSLKYYKDTNSFYCFGCKRGGDVITFVKELYKVDFKEALDIICK